MSHVTDCVDKETCEQEKGCTTIIKHYYGCGHNGCDEGSTGGIGTEGKSAYQIALDNGFVGTLDEWLVSLKGSDGQQGAAATISVGTVSTVAAGSAATVINTGTSAEAVLNFSIPQGHQGGPGAQGIEGLGIWTTATQLATSGNTASVNVATVAGRALKVGDLVISSHENSPGILHRVTTAGTLGTANTTTTYVGNIRGATGSPGTPCRMTVEYATFAPLYGAPSLSGSATTGYATSGIGASVAGGYRYDLIFATLYNPVSDILEIQHYLHNTWAVWTSAPYQNDSEKEYGVALTTSNATNPTSVYIGRGGINPEALWGRPIRVVKKSFPI